MPNLSALDQLLNQVRELCLSAPTQAARPVSWWDSVKALWEGGFFSLNGWVYSYLIFAWAIVSTYLIVKRWREVYQTKWYRPVKCQWSPEPGWEDVEKIILGEPLDHATQFRSTKKWVFALDGLKLIGIVIVLWLLIYSLPFWLNDFTSKLNGKDNQTFLIYLIGGGTVAVTFLMAFMQFRAKVKAENRQKWIDKFREVLTEILANLPDDDDVSMFQEYRNGTLQCELDDRLRVKKETCSKHIWLLELMINPSEKDHRTLITMLRMLQAPYNGYNINKRPIKVDKIVVEKVSLLAKLKPHKCNRYQDREMLLTYTINLFHAVLKKEWERVKRGI